MRGRKDYDRMAAADEQFVGEAMTAPVFRLWSVAVVAVVAVVALVALVGPGGLTAASRKL